MTSPSSSQPARLGAARRRSGVPAFFKKIENSSQNLLQSTGTDLDSTVRHHKIIKTKANRVLNKLEVSLCHETFIDPQSTDLQSNARHHSSQRTNAALRRALFNVVEWSRAIATNFRFYSGGQAPRGPEARRPRARTPGLPESCYAC